MKICVAQTRPFSGDIQGNIGIHTKLIDLAVSDGADLIIFPELSLTGYEPELAKTLATSPDDPQFIHFQELSDLHQISIGVGMPLHLGASIAIGMLVFQPQQVRQTYFKQHLHPDEYPYFVAGPPKKPFVNDRIALAICYELSIPEHAEEASRQDAKIYIASVAKTKNGVEKASERLAEIAVKYHMTVLMANSTGPSDNFISGGNTAVWNSEGALLDQLDEAQEGTLIFDTKTAMVIKKTL